MSVQYYLTCVLWRLRYCAHLTPFFCKRISQNTLMLRLTSAYCNCLKKKKKAKSTEILASKRTVVYQNTQKAGLTGWFIEELLKITVCTS